MDGEYSQNQGLNVPVAITSASSKWSLLSLDYIFIHITKIKICRSTQQWLEEIPVKIKSQNIPETKIN